MLTKLKKGMINLVHRFYGGKEFVSSLMRLFSLIFQHKFYLFMAIICMVGYNVFTAAPAWYIKNVVDTLEKGHVPPISQFALVGLAIVFIYSLKGIFFFGQSYLMGLVGQRLMHDLRNRLYAHLQSLSFSFFTKTPSGDLISRFTSDMLNLQNALKVSIAGPLRDIPQIFIFLFILVYRSWELFILSLLLIPVALYLISKFGQRNKKLTSERLVTFGQMTTLLLETISGIRVVKAFGMEKYEQGRFNKSSKDLLRKQMRTVAIASYSTPILEIIGSVAGAAIVLVGGYLIIYGQITGGDFVSFLFAFFMLNQPVKKLNGFNLIVHEGIAAADRVFELLDVEPEEVDKPGAPEIAPFKNSIQININRFHYNETEKPTLSKIKMEVKAGEVVALVGASGSGKTTLVNLIPRFFDLKDGEIKFDGINIQDVTLNSLRAQIAIVTQEIFLFNDTVANNIAYGNIECPREEIEKAARNANAHDFIQAMPKGYDTQIGESGSALSGGQRQRLSIARALIKNAPILILDEATSALDYESEKEVQKALDNLLVNRTTIVIAHRLSTISRANIIHVLDAGKIVESGKHIELMELDGKYKRLYEMQFRDIPQLDKQTRRRWWNRLSAEDKEGLIESG